MCPGWIAAILKQYKVRNTITEYRVPGFSLILSSVIASFVRSASAKASHPPCPNFVALKLTFVMYLLSRSTCVSSFAPSSPKLGFLKNIPKVSLR
jgi:hypothetical protein